MPATVLTMIAFFGLGCQNKYSEPGPMPILGGWSQVSPTSGSFATTNGVPGAASLYGQCDSDGYSGSVLHDTLWSFVLGRDPSVPTARELEESFYSGGYAEYAQLEMIPSARRPPSR
jgi:hypothetical protein